jgi:hypothetical protein
VRITSKPVRGSSPELPVALACGELPSAPPFVVVVEEGVVGVLLGFEPLLPFDPPFPPPFWPASGS